MLRIALELPIIVTPSISQLRKVFEIKILTECHWIHVVDSPLPVKLISLPMSFICNATVLIVELAEPVHLVLIPLSLVMTPVLEIQHAVAFPHTIF